MRVIHIVRSLFPRVSFAAFVTVTAAVVAVVIWVVSPNSGNRNRELRGSGGTN